jgi:hypothetical protein
MEIKKKKHYKIQIREINQPLLIVLPKASDKRRGQTGPIILLPELCILTGVDEQMRTDFRFKKAIDVHTKLQPNDRCNRLTNFINAFKSYVMTAHCFKFIYYTYQSISRFSTTKNFCLKNLKF